MGWRRRDRRAIRAWTAADAPSVDIDPIEREVREGRRRSAAGADGALRRDRTGAESLRVDPEALAEALAGLDTELREALELAIANVRAVAAAQIALGGRGRAATGTGGDLREVPVGAAGIYAPGGRAAYPSSVLMGVVPARVAGVERLVLATPPGPDGGVPPLVLATAALCEVDEVYAVGGAQAIFALAYGTETIDPVDVVAGPGNAWVREAKRAVSGIVGIDSLAGPSELMVVAGHDIEPEWAALDLCAQAEHGAEGPLLVAAVEEAVLDAIEQATERAAAERPGVGDAPLALVQVPDLSDAIDLANAFAPEHLELLERGRGPARRARHDRRLRLRRPPQRDRLRRLRRRLQPRAADRRRGALLRPARPRRLPPQDRNRAGPAGGGGETRSTREDDRPRRGLPCPRRVGDD